MCCSFLLASPAQYGYAHAKRKQIFQCSPCLQRGVSHYAAAWFDEVIDRLRATLPTIGEHAAYQLLSCSAAVAMLTVARALQTRASKEPLPQATKALILQDAREFLDGSGLRSLERYALAADAILNIAPDRCMGPNLAHLAAYTHLTDVVEAVRKDPPQLCWCNFCGSN
jgi:hypothetical protein